MSKKEHPLWVLPLGSTITLSFSYPDWVGTSPVDTLIRLYYTQPHILLLDHYCRLHREDMIYLNFTVLTVFILAAL